MNRIYVLLNSRSIQCLVLAGLTVLYLISAISGCLGKPFWLDEYFTLDLARLPTAGIEWNALMAGADHTPPLFQFVTRFTGQLTGFSQIGLRIPALLGFWVMCLCLFFFVRKTCGPIPAIVAFVIPMLTKAEEYSFEARGYGLMLGLCGLALISWQRRWFVPMGLFLGAAYLSHPYAVFLLLALGAGECVIAWQNQRIDWRMAAALGLSLLPLVVLSRILIEAGNLNKTGLDLANWKDVPGVYSSLFEPFLTCGAAIFALILFVVFFLRRREPQAQDPLHVPDSDWAVAIACVLLPLPVVVATIAIHGFFNFRYAILSAVGASLLVVYAVGSSRRFGRLLMPLVLVVLILFLVNSDRTRLHFRKAPPAVPILNSLTESELPIYFQDPYLYMDLVHRWPLQMVKRLHYVADPDLADLYKRAGTIDYCVINIAPYTPLALDDYASLRKRRRDFLLYYSPGPYEPGRFGWLMQKLADDGVQMDLLEQNGQVSIFRVLDSRL